ncbi:MAG: hypothetical protein R2882_02940 [Gemmatimonadales bacterium]
MPFAAPSLVGSAVAAGTVTAWATDTTIGPLFRVPVTIATGYAILTGPRLAHEPRPGGNLPIFFQTKAGRPFRASMATTAQTQAVLAFLHEPGGQPFRVENGREGGFGNDAAVYDVDGRDAIGGIYEAVAVAPPSAGADVRIAVQQSPVTLDASRTDKETVKAVLTNETAAPITGSAMLGWIGAERTSRSASAARPNGG